MDQTIIPPRLQREWKTVKIMIQIYCRDHHFSERESLCESCLLLQNYAGTKLQNCFFQEEKPTCANCTIHCYRKSKQKEIREIMRYAGPKMIFRYPVLAIKHLLDGRKSVENPKEVT